MWFNALTLTQHETMAMKNKRLHNTVHTTLQTGLLAAVLVFISACQSTGSMTQSAEICTAPLSQRLDLAIAESQTRMESGCQAQHTVLFEQLLTVGEGDPKPENKRMFSDYLVWASDKGVISPLQAKETYTRYFGIKFVSGLSDYNTCAAFCPVEVELLADMKVELNEKARGLLTVSKDQSTYGRANSLFSELELVIAATCKACNSQ